MTVGDLESFDRLPDLSKFAKRFEVWPLQADFVQHWGDLLQVGHKKQCSHILICNFLISDNLLPRDLALSFGSAREQKVQFKVLSFGNVWLPASSPSCQLFTK